MDKNYKLLLASFVAGSAVYLLPVSVAPLGLSSVLGLSLMTSALLGSSVLGVSVLSSTVLQPSGAAAAIAASYSSALALVQVLVSVSSIGVLVFTEMTDPSYGKVGFTVGEMRKSLTPIALVTLVLFAAIVAVRILAIVK